MLRFCHLFPFPWRIKPRPFENVCEKRGSGQAGQEPNKPGMWETHVQGPASNQAEPRLQPSPICQVSALTTRLLAILRWGVLSFWNHPIKSCIKTQVKLVLRHSTLLTLGCYHLPNPSLDKVLMFCQFLPQNTISILVTLSYKHQLPL